MKTRKAQLHIHSNYTDGLYSVETILKEAKKRKFDIISITDHNEIRGTIRAFELAKKYDLLVIPGIELYFKIDNRIYDLLVYFKEMKDLEGFFADFRKAKEFIPCFKNINELIDKVKKYKGISVIPHPYNEAKGLFKKKGLKEDIFKTFEGIETIDAFNSNKQNKKAENYFKDKNILKFGGCDLHIYLSSLDCAYTLLKSKSEIDYNNVWDNLVGKKKTIEFIPKGNALPSWKRKYQEIICIFLIGLFITKQFLKFKLDRNEVK